MKTDINRILIYVLIGIGGIIFFFTVLGFISGKASCHHIRHSDPAGISEINGAGENLAEIKDLGTVRAVTKAEGDVSTGVSLAVAPWFAYEKTDSAFKEELAYKKQGLKSIFIQYFAGHTQKELFSIGEKQVKEDLLQLVNNSLEMGKIEAIYFDEYIFFD